MQKPAQSPRFPEPSSWGPGVLLAVPFGVLAMIPWLGEPGRHAGALSATLTLVALAVGWRARPRRQRITDVASAGEPAAVHLTHRLSSDGRGDQLYAVEHNNGNTRSIVALGKNPAQVLEHALKQAQRANTTLGAGWGLDTDDVEALAAKSSTRRSSRRGTTMTVRAPRSPGSRSATITLALISFVVLIVVLSGALLGESKISPVSTILASFAVALPLGLSTLTASRIQVDLADNSVKFFRAGFGWRRLEASFSADEVLHVCAVSPTGRFKKHLLLRTVFGLQCIECAEASRLARAVHEGWKHTGGPGSQ